jgi:hypothetical protein
MWLSSLHLKALVVVCLQALHGHAMFTKRPLPDLRNLSPSKRLKANLENLFLTAEVSADRAGSIFRDAAALAPQEFGRLAKASSSKAHVARNLLRVLTKAKRGWPSLYIANIVVWDRRNFCEKTVPCPFLLPHELIHALLIWTPKETLCSVTGLAPRTLRHLQECKDCLKSELVVPIAIWGDGVPCNWDRTQSIETFAMSLPGLDAKGRTFRMPLMGLSKKYIASKATYNSIFNVLKWSFEVLASGSLPACRHDGAAWGSSDHQRKKLSGQQLGVRGVLCEVRADWVFLSSCCNIPPHNLKAGCCWRCRVTPDGIANFASDAPWRSQRLTHVDLLCRMHEQGLQPSSIWAIPFFKSSCFAIDWLHTCDKGCAAYFLGNLFWHCLPRLPGRNKQQKVASLWSRIAAFYTRNTCETKYDALTVLMIKKNKEGPCLRGSAAEIRSLVPFGLELAAELLAAGDQKDLTILQCAKNLADLYNCLHKATFCAERLAMHVKRFCVLYAALHELSEDKCWKLKPKFHLLAEMGMDDTNPSDQWTYRDEDFGGTVARLSRRRGGPNTVMSTGRAMLLKFMASNAVPAL